MVVVLTKILIMSSEDIVRAGSSPLSFSYQLFAESHVLDIYVPNIHFDLTTKGELPEVPPLFGTYRSHVMLELMHVSKSLQEVIMTSIVCNNKVDELIKFMVPKGFEASTSQNVEEDDGENVEDEEDTETEVDTKGSEDGYESGSLED